MKSEYVTLLTVTVSLLSGWGGAFIAGHFSRKASTDAIDKEHQIAVEKRKEEERIELLQLYVSIIRMDFEENPVEYQMNGSMSLDHAFFNKEIRPKIYEKYYLIHENVILHFNQIEHKNSAIVASDAFGGFDDMDVIHIAQSYENMIEEIKLLVNKERMTTME